MDKFQSLDDLDKALHGKRVLLRADLNVPLQNGKVSDAARIERLVPSLKELSRAGAKVIILSHFGRPKGRIVPEMSLSAILGALSQALDDEVAFAQDCIGPAAEAAVAELKGGGYLLLENLRFHEQEEKNDGAFADRLAALGDLYVNDAFSCAHRAHASTEALAHRLPAFAGRLMQAELEALGRALGDPQRPLAALVGGAKIASKLDVLGHLIDQVDVLIIGGGMANTFLNAKGIAVGASLCEHDLGDTARRIMDRAEAAGCRLLLPVDAVVAREFRPGAAHAIVEIDQVGEDQMILDVGPATVEILLNQLSKCQTLVWNGPLGAFEIDPFGAGTNAVARRVGELSRSGRLVSVAGGGDTVAALNQAGAAADFSYVSTAGGAFLEWLEGRTLPGVAALEQFQNGIALKQRNDKQA